MALKVDASTSLIDALVRPLDRTDRPGGAVGVALGGVPVYRRGFGLSSLELPLAVTTATRIRIGSVSKQFLAYLFLLLARDGAADLDAPIAPLFPEFPGRLGGVTPRMLFTHVSGLRDPLELSWLFTGTGRRVNIADLMDGFARIADIDSAPGESWRYNNFGYVLMSVAVERLTGLRLEDVLERRVFAPLGMFDTRLRRWDDDFLANSATLHMARPGGGFSRDCLESELVGEGGIVSTADDLLRWLQHIRSPGPAAESLWAAMRAPQTVGGGASTGYGLGYTTSTYRGLEVEGHAGGVMGATAQVLRAPQADLDIVVLMNRYLDAEAFAPDLAFRILDACIFGGPAAETGARDFRTAGVFRSAATDRVIELARRDDRQAVMVDGAEWGVTWAADGAAGLDGTTPRRLVLEPPGEEPGSIVFEDGAQTDRLLRLPAAGWDPGRYLGDFVAESIGVSLAIVARGRDLVAETRGWNGSTTYRLREAGPGVLQATADLAFPPGGVLCFGEDGEGFTLRTFRSSVLRFRRRRASADEPSL